MEIFARERKNFTRESGSRRATNNNSPFTEAIIDHRAPIEAYRFDTTDLERWCVKTEAGEWIIPRVEKELRGCQSSPMCFESETWVTIHRSLPRIDLDGLELDAPTDVTSTSLRSLEREMNWLVSVDATFFLTRVDEITRVPRSFDMVARHCDRPHTNRPTLYIYIYIFFFSSFFLLLSLPPPLVWSTRWRINFTRLSTRHTTSWSFAMRHVSNSFFFFLFLTNYWTSRNEFSSESDTRKRGSKGTRWDALTREDVYISQSRAGITVFHAFSLSEASVIYARSLLEISPRKVSGFVLTGWLIPLCCRCFQRDALNFVEIPSSFVYNR